MTSASNSESQAKRKLRPRLIGIVTSDKVNKTRKVTFEYLSRHPKYNKYVKRQTVLHVHDEENASHVGDRVEVMACRPLSKTKSYRLVRILTQVAAIDTSILEGEASQLFAKHKGQPAGEKPAGQGE